MGDTPMEPTGPGAGGALVIDKPAGLTSHDVVAAVRRALGETRVGHTGTLDPFATGVLPLLLGRATRLARFLAGADKTYEARVSFTGETDTDDATGAARGAPSGAVPAADRLEAALLAFRGSFLQVPPAYSAKKIAGRRAYELARQAAAPALAPAAVTVSALRLAEWTPPVAVLHLTCSAGFYVRALARDLGRAVGVGAHLEALRRVASGGFRLEDAVPLDVVLREPGLARRVILPPARAVGHLPALELSGTALERLRHGGPVTVDPAGLPASSGGAPEHVRLMDPAGVLVAIAASTSQPGVLQPVVVLM